MYNQPEQVELVDKNPAVTVQGYNNQQTMAGGYPGYHPPMSGYQQPPPGYQPGFQQPQSGYQPGYQQPQPGYQPGHPPPPPGYHPPQQQVHFMPRPAGIPGVPQGLEYLTQISQLLIQQQVEVLEIVTSWETENKYKILNTLGQQVYFAAEESGTCERQCCGPQRGFFMHITDNLGQEVLRAVREFKCCSGWNCCACLDCCACEIRIEAPVGQVIGYTRQLKSCTQPRYSVRDAEHQEVLYVEGPMCVCQCICCPRDQDFKIMTQDRTHEIGKITKQWTGFVKEIYTDADNFSVSFPMDLDVRLKAILLGSVFLIDFMYFEQKQNKNKHHR